MTFTIPHSSERSIFGPFPAPGEMTSLIPPTRRDGFRPIITAPSDGDSLVETTIQVEMQPVVTLNVQQFKDSPAMYAYRVMRHVAAFDRPSFVARHGTDFDLTFEPGQLFSILSDEQLGQNIIAFGCHGEYHRDGISKAAEELKTIALQAVASGSRSIRVISHFEHHYA